MTISVKANADGSGTFLHNGSDVLTISSTGLTSFPAITAQGSKVTTVTDFDNLIALNGTSSTMSGVSDSRQYSTGYQKLPGGLVLQWGAADFFTATDSTTGARIILPIQFPNACVQVITSDGGMGCHATGSTIVSNQEIRVWGKNNPNGGALEFVNTRVRWLAIGF